MRQSRNLLTSLVSLDPEIPLYNAYGMRVGSIAVSRAIELHGRDLELRAKGSGRRRRFTSAKLYARISQLWMPRDSGGYLVLQFITERK